MSANRCMCPVQQEEEKAWKKIRQTKARATEIVQLRRENEARVLERQLAAEQLSAQQAEIVQRHHREKELQRQARLVRRVERCITVSPLTMRLQRLQEEKEKEKQKAALAVKASKAQHKKEVERQRKAEVIKARKAKVAIRVEREAARKRREQKEVRCSCVVECVASGLRSCVAGSVYRQHERLQRNKVAYHRRVEAEEQLRVAKESEVSRLEAMEMQLIERLKKTQAQQQKAYHDLEVALAGNAS